MAAFTIRDAKRLSHAYILSSPDREACLALAEEIAAAAVCQRETDAPCGQCRACRKARSGNHPDIIHIRCLTDSKGQPRRELLVEQIRQMAADAYVLPNEAARKVYIVDDADKMNPAAQNAALKTLEEPPAGVIFLLCVENAGLLLPTVRSRCVELRTNGEAAEEDEGAVKLARSFLKLVARGDEAELCRWCIQNDRLDKSEAAAFFDSLSQQLGAMLCAQADSLGLERGQLWTLYELAEKGSAWLQVNVGIRQVFGLLAVDALAGHGNRG